MPALTSRSTTRWLAIRDLAPPTACPATNPALDEWAHLIKLESQQVQRFCKAAWDKAGLLVKPSKSNTLLIGFDTSQSEYVTEEEVQKHSESFTFLCENCGNWWGVSFASLRSHKALHCPRRFDDGEEGHEITAIVDDTTTFYGRHYRVRWKHHATDEWVPEWELIGNEVHAGTAKEAVADYWELKAAGNHTPCPRGGNVNPKCKGGPHQCRWCCFSTSDTVSSKNWIKPDHGRKIHESKCKHKPKQRGLASLSAKALRSSRKSKLIQSMPKVTALKRSNGKWHEAVLENVASFIYLGSNVEGGRRTLSEIKHRLAIASVAFQKHRRTFSARQLTLNQKLDAYQMYVIETAINGHEGWSLDKAAIARLRSFNTSCMATITKKLHKDVARCPPLDIIPLVKARRATWLGHVLRMDKDEPPHQLLREIMRFNSTAAEIDRITGTVLDEAPPGTSPSGVHIHDGSFGELVEAAKDRKYWRQHVAKLESEIRKHRIDRHVSVVSEATGQFGASGS